MAIRNSVSLSPRLFDPLEQRNYLANPVVINFAADVTETYAGQTITLTALTLDDTAVRAVAFWIEDNQDALNQFIARSFDQQLGDVFAPDSGTADRFSLQVRVGASWKPSTRFGVDVQDVEGNWSQAPIQFVTVAIRPKPFVLGMRAETLGNGDVRLTATTSTDGETITGTGIGGVTFFVDNNGNNQWDPGADVDLGIGSMVSGGVYELSVTPQGGWNPWFTASAFDTRAGTDRFGPNRSTVRRGDATPPVISNFDIIPPDNDTNAAVFTSNERVRFYAEYAAASGVLGATMFHDRNQNGLWDAGVDATLRNRFPLGSPPSDFFDLFQSLGALENGWQSIGIAVRDNSGRGDDAWSAVTTLWINIDNTPWITNPVVTPDPVPVGTASLTLTFRARDDDGVMGVRSSFINVDRDGGSFAEAGDPLGTNLRYLTVGRRNALWELTFATGSLVPGTYDIHIWLQDYREVSGPRTVVSFTVV